MQNVDSEIAELKWFLCNALLSPFSKIQQRQRIFVQFPSSVKHLQTLTQNVLKFRRASYKDPPAGPLLWADKLVE